MKGGRRSGFAGGQDWRETQPPALEQGVAGGGGGGGKQRERPSCQLCNMGVRMCSIVAANAIKYLVESFCVYLPTLNEIVY